MTLISLVIKEFQQILHNAFTLRIIMFYVLVIALLQPLLLTLDIKSLTVAVVDRDNSELSRRIVESICHSDQLNATYVGADLHAANVMLDESKAQCIVEIPPHFERSLVGSTTDMAKREQINISTNAVNTMRGIQGTSFVTGCVAYTVSQYGHEKGVEFASAEELTETLFYNPTQDYRNFVLPTVFFLFICYICGTYLTATVQEEKQRGTIEQINVCPISRHTFVSSKIITFVIIGMFAFLFDIVLLGYVYKLFPSGGIITMCISMILFSVCECCLAITMGNTSRDSTQAVMMVFFVNYIFQVTSGFITPIECMPEWLQPFTHLVPMRYTVIVLRNAYLKGATILDLWQEIAGLAALALVFYMMAVKSYKRVED